MELALARNGKSCQLLRVFVQLHLPESGSQVQCCENGGVGSAYVADTFGDFFHGVLVDMGVLVELPEILYNAKSLALFLWNAENG
jgi:hypothetical protein